MGNGIDIQAIMSSYERVNMGYLSKYIVMRNSAQIAVNSTKKKVVNLKIKSHKMENKSYVILE
ncbi:MAG: hypothetical protein IPK46_22560 [Saprospiraceae bacterium]|nr:hypothetical protein [Saprospiraceae bacterium]